MEEILRKLQKEASGSKHRAIKESCTCAIGEGRRAAAAGLPAGERSGARPGPARSGAGREPPEGGGETPANLFGAASAVGNARGRGCGRGWRSR